MKLDVKSRSTDTDAVCTGSKVCTEETIYSSLTSQNVTRPTNFFVFSTVADTSEQNSQADSVAPGNSLQIAMKNDYDVKKIKLVRNVAKKGRPKGSVLNEIGLPKKKEKFNFCHKFVDMPKKIKIILSRLCLVIF